MIFIKRLGRAFLFGVGFAIGLILVFTVIEKLDLTPGKKKPKETKEEIVLAEVEKVNSAVHSVKSFQGRVIVSTSAKNNNSVPVENIKLYVTIFYPGQPIEECFEWDLKLDVNESKTIPIYCKWRWKDLVEEKLTATSRIVFSKY